MGTSDSFAGAARKLERVAAVVEKLPKTAGHAVGKMGRGELLDLASRTFGADRKFSGARTSRKARRIAGARYKVVGQQVEMYPTGDPFFIFLKGRGRHVIRPRRGAKALRLPDGGRRRSVLGGRLTPRPHLLDPAVRAIRQEAPRIVDRNLAEQIGRVL
jgi:hypothetical protein